MHLADETLRPYLDNELSEPERARAAVHLQSCASCRARFDALDARAAETNRRLAVLAPGRADAPRPASLAFAKLDARRNAASQKDGWIMTKSLFSPRLRPVWMGLVAIVVVAVAFTFQPVQAWAGQFLDLFRVKQVEVIPIDTNLLTQLSGNSALGQEIGRLLSSSVTATEKPGKPQVAKDVADASRLAGFQVRLPASRSDAPQLYVTGRSAFQFVVDRKLAQELLDQAGRSDLQLPQSIDGATIKVVIPAGVSAGYGSCPRPEGVDKPAGAISGTSGRRYSDCVIMEQIPSPTLDAPPNLDVKKLAEIGLEFSGMKPQQAHDFAQTIDWTSTLVIPLPRNAAQYKQMTLDGANGYLIQRPADDAPQYALIWVKNGIIYAIGGLGTDSTAAIQMANSLK